jgi:hypothetical protein
MIIRDAPLSLGPLRVAVQDAGPARRWLAVQELALWARW